LTMLTSEQVRAARALLSWSEERLAAEANLPLQDVRQFEDGGLLSHVATSDVLRRALEAAGAEFIAGNGSVCVHFPSPEADAGMEPRHGKPPRDDGTRPQDLTAENDG